MFQNLGFGEILILALVILVLFGGKKIPEVMGGLGKGMKEFKKAMRDEDTPESGSKKEIEK
jgi:sec-independent protein translocase protein TatA